MKTLLCYGDSNTYGSSPMQADGAWTRYGPGVRWPSRLAAQIADNWTVIENGLPGRTTCFDNPFEGPHKNGLTHLPVALECHAPLDLVAVKLGTNDLKGYLNLVPQDIAKGMRTILTKIAQSNAGPRGAAPKLLVISPVPIEECGPTKESLLGGAEKSRALAGLYQQLAQEFDAGFFDAGRVAQVSPVDGVHLEPDAHIAIGDALAAYMADSGLL